MNDLPHDLCACAACTEAARLILRDVYTHHAMTVPERRRARGEAPFLGNGHSVTMAQTFMRREFTTPRGGFEVGWWAREMVAVYLRALVAQHLVDRIADFAAWLMPEVST